MIELLMEDLRQTVGSWLGGREPLFLRETRWSV